MVYIQKLKYLCILKNCHRCSKTLWQKREEETVFSISYDGGKIPFFHFEKISFLLVYNIGNVEKNQLSLWIPANLLIKKIILKIITTDLIWKWIRFSRCFDCEFPCSLVIYVFTGYFWCSLLGYLSLLYLLTKFGSQLEYKIFNILRCKKIWDERIRVENFYFWDISFCFILIFFSLSTTS